MVCIAIDRPAEREVACARAGDSLEAETGAQQLLAEVAWRDVIRIQHDLAHHEPTARPEYPTELHRMVAVMQDGLERWRSLPPRRTAREVVRAMIAAHTVEPELHRVFMEELPRMGRDGGTELEAAFEALARTYLETHRDHLRPGDLCTAAFVVVQAVEAITHAAVLHRPELLESDILLDEVTELVVRYLEPPPADSASALSNPAM